MRYRTGIRAVVYKIKNGKPFYLVLKRKKRWIGWELIKGGKQKNESYEEALIRELREEIGCRKENIEKFFNIKNKDIFIYPVKYKKIFKKDAFKAKDYAVKIKLFKIKLSDEHSSYRWLSYSKAKKILTHKESKKLLEKAHNIIKNEK